MNKKQRTGLYLLKTFETKENDSMAIENIQYVYDHMRLYRRALRPVINDFLFTKRTTSRDNKEIKRKMQKRCRSGKVIFGP